MNRDTDHQLCSGECPIKKTAEVLDGKWTTLIIRELLSGKKRYSDFQKVLPDISAKMLRARLREREAQNIASRTVHQTVPPTTEYELTPLGHQLNQVLTAMADFGQKL